jgi:uncharacterized alpha-E superfamily protein
MEKIVLSDAMLSRVADNLYWMSRYLERAEHLARVVGVQFNMSLDVANAPQRWSMVAESLRLKVPASGLVQDPYAFARDLAFDYNHPQSIVVCITQARENARQVRELISSEMWEQINRLYLWVRDKEALDLWDDQPLSFFQQVKEGAHLFQGLTDSTMTHGEAWRYIQLGRYLERTLSIARLLETHFTIFPETPDRAIAVEEYFEWLGLLKCCTAWEAYCKVYSAELHPQYIAEFLLLNPSFPHAVRFSVERIEHALLALADITRTPKTNVHRLAGKLLALLDYTTIQEISDDVLQPFLKQVQTLCDSIHAGIYEHYIAYTIESAI